MNTKRIIIIAGQHIEVEEKCLKHSDLDFYPENPRIYNTIHAEIGDNPTQKVIESAMKKLDSVKTLKQSIEVNGGLLEPIIVRRNVVLEGNSRLAAYRMLAEKDPIKWADIRCNVLPDDTSDDVVFSLLGTLHIIGKTPWSPFEQAGYLYRRTQTSRKPITALADEFGLQHSVARQFIAVYKMMLEASDTEPSKWSYYFELHKNADIKKANEDNPRLNIVQTLIDQIKDDKIPESKDIRKIGKILKSKGENSVYAKEGLLDGSLTIDEALELVSTETKIEAIKAKVDNFVSYLTDNKEDIREYVQDPSINFAIKKIIAALSSMVNE